MVADGFNSVTLTTNSRFDKVEKRLQSLEGSQNKMEKQLGSLEDGQEQIKLRLDNVPYRFELVELQKRVQFLEHKAGVKS